MSFDVLRLQPSSPNSMINIIIGLQYLIFYKGPTLCYWRVLASSVMLIVNKFFYVVPYVFDPNFT